MQKNQIIAAARNATGELVKLCDNFCTEPVQDRTDDKAATDPPFQVFLKGQNGTQVKFWHNQTAPKTRDNKIHG